MEILFHKPFKVGERVIDDLTKEEAIVIGIEYKEGKRRGDVESSMGCWAVWIDNPYVGGGRHPWEVSSLEERK